MKTSPSDRSFEKGLACLRRADALGAMALFEASLRLAPSNPGKARRAKLLSYYGYSMAQAQGRVKEGLTLCRQAARSDFYSPDVLLNLARVLCLAGDRKDAWETVVKGLRLDPEHDALRALALEMGVRRRPVLPFLGRSHPLNKLAGRMAAGSESVEPTQRRRKKNKTTSWWS